MAFEFFKRSAPETRARAVEDPQVSMAAKAPARSAPETRARIGDMVSSGDGEGWARVFGGSAGAGGAVTIDDALRVPAIWAAVNFLAKSLANLPIKAFVKDAEGRHAAPDDPAAALLNVAANDETTAFDFRYAFWVDVFTHGRGVAFIERNGRGVPINIWPLEVARVSLRRRGGRTSYLYQDGGRSITYAAADVLDLRFMPGASPLSARSPVYFNADTISLALSITRYGAKFFNNGGIPPFVVEGPMQTAASAQRAADDLSAAVSRSSADGNAVTLPAGHKLTPLGIDPDKMQMVETQRFVIEQIARIYGIPPAFLQDLTHGTFSNVEQQDLQLVKHVVAPWARAFEDQAALKFYGRAERGGRFVKNVLDGILRGDRKTRSESIAREISTGQITPDEARALDDRPSMPGGDVLYMQGAMAPITTLQNGPNRAHAPRPAEMEGE